MHKVFTLISGLLFLSSGSVWAATEDTLLVQGANLNDVTAPLFFRGDKDFDGKDIHIKNIYYSIK